MSPTLARFVAAGVVGTCLVAAVSAGAAGNVLASDPASLSSSQIDGVTLILAVSEGIVGLGSLVTGSLFITWHYQALGAVHPDVAFMARHGRGWSIGSWFVPFLNLVRPAQMVTDLWLMASVRPPHRVEDTRWARVRGAPRVVALWWGTWLVANAVDRLGGAIVGDEIRGVDDLRGLAGVVLLSDVLLVVAGVLAVWVVLGAADLLAGGEVSGEDDPWRFRGRAWPVAVGATAILLTGVLVVAGSIGDGAASIVDGDGGVTVDRLQVGDCYDEPVEPGGFVLEVTLLPCDEPHEVEVVGVTRHALTRGVTFPGREVLVELATPLCLAEFESRLGRTYASAVEFSVRLINPSEESWSLGDRGIVCVVYRSDGGLLEQPLVP